MKINPPSLRFDRNLIGSVADVVKKLLTTDNYLERSVVTIAKDLKTSSISKNALSRGSDLFSVGHKHFAASTKISTEVLRQSIGDVFSKIYKFQATWEDNKKIGILQKEIDTAFIKLKISPDDQKIEIQNEIAMKAAAIKAINCEAKVFQLIAQGKAKMVYIEYQANDNKAYYTPVGKNIFNRAMKQMEIAEEIETGLEIKSILSKLDPDDSETYIAIDMTIIKDPNAQKSGEYTVETSKAKGDLDGAIKKGTLKFPLSASIGFDVLRGMSNFHKAGFVHGDGKSENILIVEGKDGKLMGRVSDLGKTRKMEAGQSGIHVGNPRFAAPEGGIGHRQEVYTTAIMIIAALEGELLDQASGKDMLIPKEMFEVDPKVNTEKGFGIEKFLIANKACAQTDNSTLKKKVKILGEELLGEMFTKTGLSKSNSSNLVKGQEQTDMYINALVTGLSEKYPNSSADVAELGELLKEMTRADVGSGSNSRTASLADAIPRYEAIMNRLEG
jgi:serine/threonine protein kinase